MAPSPDNNRRFFKNGPSLRESVGSAAILEQQRMGPQNPANPAEGRSIWTAKEHPRSLRSVPRRDPLREARPIIGITQSLRSVPPMSPVLDRVILRRNMNEVGEFQDVWSERNESKGAGSRTCGGERRGRPLGAESSGDIP